MQAKIFGFDFKYLQNLAIHGNIDYHFKVNLYLSFLFIYIIFTIVAAVVGLVGAAVQFSCEKGHMHMFVENIVCSLSVAVAIGFLTAALPGTYDTDLLIISCIMPFVPGAAITNAVFDTLHGDYLSGLARAAEAFVIALAVAIGIGMGLFVMAVVLGR